MKKARRPHKNTPERFDLIGNMEAVSATEQTGLIASAPINEYEYNSYNEIIDFQPPAQAPKKTSRKPQK